MYNPFTPILLICIGNFILTARVGIEPTVNLVEESNLQLTFLQESVNLPAPKDVHASSNGEGQIRTARELTRELIPGYGLKYQQTNPTVSSSFSLLRVMTPFFEAEGTKPTEVEPPHYLR